MRKTLRICLRALCMTCLPAVSALTGYNEKGTVSPGIPVHLNAVLTNTLSDTPALAGFDREIKEYMRYWGLKGASLSVMRNDSLLYAKGYGLADQGKEMQPGNLLRMASVSKLITATGIMILQERGLLSLKDTVFGPRGILNDTVYSRAIKDPAYYRITVEDLLRHKGGFSRQGGDPMFSTRSIMIQNRLRKVPDSEKLMEIQLARPLKFEPGTTQEYSNFGYLVLSLVIEKVSGTDYETFIQDHVLHQCNCADFHLGRNYYEGRYPGEVRYYVQPDDNPVAEFNNSGRLVPRCYGGNNIEGLLGSGAWIASTPELARFVASIDGKPEVPDILSWQSVYLMTEYFDKDTYSLGWNDTKPTGEWTRTGTFAGTSALVKYFPEGDCWIFITNTSTWKGSELAKYTTELFEKLRAEYGTKFPKRNLFYE
jgi:CubicO group peptidase (beta-lactamase class C family)